MPLDFYGNFKPASVLKEDHLWTALTIGCAAKFAELEPKIRMRIRNLPRIASVQKDAAGKAKMEGDSLVAEDVPEPLRDRLSIPSPRRFWAGLYFCKTCNKKVYEVQMQRKQHAGHDVERTRIIKRGLTSSWQPDFRLCIGPSKAIEGTAAVLGYSIAVTAPPIDPKHLLGRYPYHAVFILPLVKNFDYAAEKKRLKKKLPEAELIEVLPGKPAEYPGIILSYIKKTDKNLIDTESSDANDDDDDLEELKGQLDKEGFDEYKKDLQKLTP